MEREICCSENYTNRKMEREICCLENYRDSRKREKKYNADDLTNSGDNSGVFSGGNSGIFSGKSFEDISVNNSDDSSDKDSDVISKKVFGVTSGDFPDSGHSPDVFSDNSNVS